jgi:hypothetical protein
VITGMSHWYLAALCISKTEKGDSSSLEVVHVFTCWGKMVLWLKRLGLDMFVGMAGKDEHTEAK